MTTRKYIRTLPLAEKGRLKFLYLAGQTFYRVQRQIHHILHRCEAAAQEESQRLSIRSKAETLAGLAEKLPGRELYREPVLFAAMPAAAPLQRAAAERSH